MGESELEVEGVKGEVDRLTRALAEARFRHVAGLEVTPGLTALFDAHRSILRLETLKRLEAAGGEGEVLRGKVAALHVEWAQSGEEEAWRAAEATAVARGPDGMITLAEAQRAVVEERDRARRSALGCAIAACAEGPRPAAVARRAQARVEVGLFQNWDRVVEADTALGISDDAYRDVLGWLARREVGLTSSRAGEFTRGDVLFSLALRSWEGLFPRGALALTLEKALAPLRFDLRRVRVDEGARPAQWLGAHAFEGWIAFRRQGGAADWSGLFAAVGQALAAVAIAPWRRPPEATFALGALLSGLLLDPGFLRERLEVDRKHVADLVRGLALRQLFQLRAHAAALRVATEAERGTGGEAWREAYREAMALATSATWPSVLAARDGDGEAHAAALRGAAQAAELRRGLVERFDEDWWKNPRSAEALGRWLSRCDAGPGEGEVSPLSAGFEALVMSLR